MEAMFKREVYDAAKVLVMAVIVYAIGYIMWSGIRPFAVITSDIDRGLGLGMMIVAAMVDLVVLGWMIELRIRYGKYLLNRMYVFNQDMK